MTWAKKYYRSAWKLLKELLCINSFRQTKNSFLFLTKKNKLWIHFLNKRNHIFTVTTYFLHFCLSHVFMTLSTSRALLYRWVGQTTIFAIFIITITILTFSRSIRLVPQYMVIQNKTKKISSCTEKGNRNKNGIGR